MEKYEVSSYSVKARCLQIITTDKEIYKRMDESNKAQNIKIKAYSASIFHGLVTGRENADSSRELQTIG